MANGVTRRSRGIPDTGSKSVASPPQSLAAAQIAGIQKRSKSRQHKHTTTVSAKQSPQDDNLDNQTPATTPNEHFPFLKLPPELRNKVYEMVFDELPTVYLMTRSRLASQSAMPRVSQQIRTEFIPCMYICAREVVVQVKNLDFGPVITFLNRLSDVEMESLIQSPGAERRMRIELSFNHFFKFSKRYVGMPPSLIPTLTRWINRIDHPLKAGNHINASYVCSNVPRFNSRHSLCRYIVFAAHIYSQAGFPKLSAEAMKVHRALGQAIDRLRL